MTFTQNGEFGVDKLTYVNAGYNSRYMNIKTKRKCNNVCLANIEA